MQPTIWAIIIVAAIVVIVLAVLAWSMIRKRRSLELRERFGPEYDRAVRDRGDQGRAEAELEARQERVEHLQLRQLSAPERDRFTDAWRMLEEKFIDAPIGAVSGAEGLVSDMMRELGYPAGEFDQRAADLSVKNPEMATHYRSAHAIAAANERGDASTEDLRQAMIHYRVLFDELLTIPSQEPEPARS